MGAGIAASETVGGVSRSAAYAYSYLANSNLLATVVSNNGSADVLALGRVYDDAGRLAAARSSMAGDARTRRSDQARPGTERSATERSGRVCGSGWRESHAFLHLSCGIHGAAGLDLRGSTQGGLLQSILNGAAGEVVTNYTSRILLNLKKVSIKLLKAHSST